MIDLNVEKFPLNMNRIDEIISMISLINKTFNNLLVGRFFINKIKEFLKFKNHLSDEFGNVPPPK